MGALQSQVKGRTAGTDPVEEEAPRRDFHALERELGEIDALVADVLQMARQKIGPLMGDEPVMENAKREEAVGGAVIDSSFAYVGSIRPALLDIRFQLGKL